MSFSLTECLTSGPSADLSQEFSGGDGVYFADVAPVEKANA